jgi:hypothetical protein
MEKKQGERRVPVGYALLAVGVAILILGFASATWEYYLLMTDPRYVVYSYAYVPTFAVKLGVILVMILTGSLISKRGISLILSSTEQKEQG